jgi:endonuclease YncB( thermonuclease family)
VEPKLPTTFDARVVGIKDGDTFTVLVDGREQVVRLANIDCPERSQPFGKAAKQFASDICFDKTVRVETTGKSDRYGRLIGTVWVDDKLEVNAQLVSAGLAWHFVKFSTDSSYALLEQQARAAGAGLWSDSTAIAPWEWRKAK